jgi:hypothetical protein
VTFWHLFCYTSLYCELGWASFSGKSAYLEPGCPEPIGNYEFLVYAEDRDEPGTGVDRFWIEVKDKYRAIVPVMSMSRDATDNAVELQGGNIAVPLNLANQNATHLVIEAAAILAETSSQCRFLRLSSGSCSVAAASWPSDKDQSPT